MDRTDQFLSEISASDAGVSQLLLLILHYRCELLIAFVAAVIDLHC
jgi:hypothetical protein